MMFIFWIPAYFSLLTTCLGNIEVVRAVNPTSVYKAPTVSIKPGGDHDYIIREFDTLAVTCVATGHPKPTIRWTIRGGALIKRQLDLRSPTLEISRITRQEGGRLACRATNGIGNPVFTTKRINVIYLDQPLITARVPENSRIPSSSIWYENTAYLWCEVVSNPPASVSWKLNGTLIFPDQKNGLTITRQEAYRVGVSTEVLKIKNADVTDTGRYECATSIDKMGRDYAVRDTKANFNYTLNIASARIQLITSSTIVVNKGDNLRVECAVIGGFPRPIITWVREDGVAYPNTVTDTQTNVLLINRLNHSDTGNYFCVGRNGVGVPASKKTQVVVRSLGPVVYWLTTNAENKLALGTNARLICHVEAAPYSEVQYTWFKLSSQQKRVETPQPDSDTPRLSITFLENDDSYRGFPLPAVSSRLDIRQLEQDDYGTYICSATLTGFSNEGIESFARIPISKDSAPATITPVNVTVVAVEGTTAVLQCIARGLPRPPVRFYRDGNMTMPNGTMEEVREDGRLEIYGVRRDDAGSYLCDAAKYNGFIKSSTTLTNAAIELIVLYPPTVEPAYSELRRKVGGKIELSCFVQDAEPSRSLTSLWTKDGVPQGTDPLNIDSIDLTNFGIYTCEVSNSIGMSSCVVNVTYLAYAPEFYYSEDDGSLYQAEGESDLFSYPISWTQKLPDAVDPILKYRIQWRQVDSKEWEQGLIDITDGARNGRLITYVIKNLEVGKYEVEVIPKNQFGDGDRGRRIIQVRARSMRQAGAQPTIHTLEAPLFCSFEGGDICNFVQSNQDDIQWSYNNEDNQKKRTRNTGPSFDYTNSQKEGGYMFIESTRVMQGDRARLISPTFWHDESRLNCLKFFYHMYGRHIGVLRVLFRDKSQNETEIWRKQGEQGDTWLPALVDIYPKTEYQIIFEAIMTEENGYQGDIALDDVMVHSNKCILPVTTTEATWNTTPPGGGAVTISSLRQWSLWKLLLVVSVVLHNLSFVLSRISDVIL